MRKYTVLIVLVATFAAIFAAAYTFYDKYGGQLAVSPPAPVSPASEQPAVEDSVPETGTSDSTSSLRMMQIMLQMTPATKRLEKTSLKVQMVTVPCRLTRMTQKAGILKHLMNTG